MRLDLRTLAIVALALQAASAFGATSKENLKIAYKGESTAYSKYTAYAARADREGYSYAATLFQAAAKAEGLHARNHKQVLAKYGITPVAGKFTGRVGTTQQNLRDALNGECYERDQMYPAMLAIAQKEKNVDAERTIAYALDAERGHAELYKQALQDMKTGKKTPAVDFYVCPKCGQTFRGTAPEACPACGTPGSRFVLVKARRGSR